MLNLATPHNIFIQITIGTANLDESGSEPSQNWQEKRSSITDRIIESQPELGCRAYQTISMDLVGLGTLLVDRWICVPSLVTSV